MLLALIALLSTADAHPNRNPDRHHHNVAVHITPPRYTYHWVSSHYNKWGRWIPGHWAVNESIETITCITDKYNRTVCTAH